MTEGKTLSEEVKEIKEILTKQSDEEKVVKPKKPRQFRIPGRAKINRNKAKKNYATVMIVNENGNVDFVREQIVDQSIMVDKVPRIATADVVCQYKGKPLIIQPLWSVKPFSRADHYMETERQMLNTKGYKVLMDRMRKEALQAKKALSWWLIIGGLILLGVVVYFLWQGPKPTG